MSRSGETPPGGDVSAPQHQLTRDAEQQLLQLQSLLRGGATSSTVTTTTTTTLTTTTSSPLMGIGYSNRVSVASFSSNASPSPQISPVSVSAFSDGARSNLQNHYIANQVLNLLLKEVPALADYLPIRHYQDVSQNIPVQAPVPTSEFPVNLSPALSSNPQYSLSSAPVSSLPPLTPASAPLASVTSLPSSHRNPEVSSFSQHISPNPDALIEEIQQQMDHS